MARRTVQLRVGGQSYRVVSSANDEELQRLAAAVEERLAPLMQPGRSMMPQQAMLLAAMALAHDLEEERARTSTLKIKFREAFVRILARVDQALSTSQAPPVPGPDDGPGEQIP